MLHVNSETNCRATLLTSPRLFHIVAMLVTLTACPFAVRADVVTLTSSKDNTLYEDAGGALSNGAGEHCFTGKKNNGKIDRAVMAYDIAGSIPAGSVINSVSLTLTLSRESSDAQEVTLHRLLADWGEGASLAGSGQGAGGPSATGDATWIHTFFSSSFWTTPGGDFDPTVSAMQTVDAEGVYTWNSTPELVADVQSWLNTPAQNFGWILVGDENAGGTDKRFDTHECDDTAGTDCALADRPQLVIDFTAPPAPAASTWGLIVMALLIATASTVILSKKSNRISNT